MERSILVSVNGIPQVNFVVEKTTTIADIKELLNNYLKRDNKEIKLIFFVNSGAQLNVFGTKEYDMNTLESVWDVMHNSTIEITIEKNKQQKRTEQQKEKEKEQKEQKMKTEQHKQKQQKQKSETEQQKQKSETEQQKQKRKTELSLEERKEFFTNKRVLTFSGCFCPPHAGHYALIENVVTKVKPDVLIVSSVNSNDNPRHGTPLSHTKETWNKWGEILANKYNIDYFFNDMESRFSFDGSLAKIKEFIDINTYEGNQRVPEKFKINPVENKTLEGFSLSYLKGVPRDFKGYYIYHIQRSGDLSATAFTKCLKDLTQDCLQFVPTDLSNHDKYEYIRNIREKYGPMLK